MSWRLERGGDSNPCKGLLAPLATTASLRDVARIRRQLVSFWVGYADRSGAQSALCRVVPCECRGSAAISKRMMEAIDATWGSTLSESGLEI